MEEWVILLDEKLQYVKLENVLFMLSVISFRDRQKNETIKITYFSAKKVILILTKKQNIHFLLWFTIENIYWI